METGHGIKYRQLHIEDYLREIPAEQGRETGVYAHEKITGNPDTNTDFDTVNHSKLIEVLSRTVKDGEGREGNLADTQVPESRSNGGRRISRSGRGRAAGRTMQSSA